MFMEQLEMNRPNGTQEHMPVDLTTIFTGNLLSMSSSALGEGGRVLLLWAGCVLLLWAECVLLLWAGRVLLLRAGHVLLLWAGLEGAVLNVHGEFAVYVLVGTGGGGKGACVVIVGGACVVIVGGV